MMKFHPRPGTLAAYSRGQLSRRRIQSLREHLAGCTACRRTVTWTSSVRDLASVATSPPAPEVFALIAARIDSGETVLLPEGSLSSGPGTRRRIAGWRVAVAGLLIAVAATSVAAVQHGGLSWIRTILTPVRPSQPLEAEADASATGVDIHVPAEGLEIALEAPAPDVVVSLATQKRELLSLTGRGDAAGARYGVAARRVTVHALHGGTLEISAPADGAGVIRLTVDGVMVGVVRNGRVTLPGAAVERDRGPITVAELVARARQGGTR